MKPLISQGASGMRLRAVVLLAVGALTLLLEPTSGLAQVLQPLPVDGGAWHAEPVTQSPAQSYHRYHGEFSEGAPLADGAWMPRWDLGLRFGGGLRTDSDIRGILGLRPLLSRSGSDWNQVWDRTTQPTRSLFRRTRRSLSGWAEDTNATIRDVSYDTWDAITRGVPGSALAHPNPPLQPIAPPVAPRIDRWNEPRIRF